MPLDTNVSFNDATVTMADGSTVRIGDMPDHAKLYYFNYGFIQSTSDSVAGMVKKLENEGKSEAEIQDALKARKEERQKSVFDGTIGQRGEPGEPRKTRREAAINSIAVEKLREAAKKVNRKLPKLGSDEWKALLATFLAKNQTAIESAADAMLAAKQDVEITL